MQKKSPRRGTPTSPAPYLLLCAHFCSSPPSYPAFSTPKRPLKPNPNSVRPSSANGPASSNIAITVNLPPPPNASSSPPGSASHPRVTLSPSTSSTTTVPPKPLKRQTLSPSTQRHRPTLKSTTESQPSSIASPATTNSSPAAVKSSSPEQAWTPTYLRKPASLSQFAVTFSPGSKKSAPPALQNLSSTATASPSPALFPRKHPLPDAKGHPG
jgi:hypothetical protein